MAEAPRLAAALRYQQELDDPTRPATVNSMMARQVAKSRELMTAPTSIMDERYPAWKKAQEDADLFLLGADAAGLAPFAAKGATVAAKFAAPKLAQGLEQHMIRSGMMLHAAPQDEALRLAQQRAALPVERGGLGLPPNNTAEQRAAIMFPESGYHATGADIKKIDATKVGVSDYGTIGQGFYIDPSNRAAYANLVAKINANKSPQNIMPLRYNADNLFDISDVIGIRDATSSKIATQKLKDAGYSGTISYVNNVPNEIAMFDSDNIRSRFAAFDPFRRNAATAAAMGVAAPDLLAKERK